MLNRLHPLLLKKKKILVMGHNGADPDSLSSMLLVHQIITTHFGNIHDFDLVVKEKSWPIFSEYNLPGYNKIRNLNSDEQINFNKYDLIFLVDISEFGERTASIPNDTTSILEKTVVIDHHTTKTVQEPMININENLSSATMQIYLAFKKMLAKDFQLTNEISYLTQVGIITDTGRFLYKDLVTPLTYQVMSELTEIYKIDTENLNYISTRITEGGLQIFTHLISNLHIQNKFSYTYIDPLFVTNNNLTIEDIDNGVFKYISTIITNIDHTDFGFVVKQKENNLYSVGFRGKNANVVKYAEYLGGGGHTFAAGCRIKANTINDAINSVTNAIMEINSQDNSR